MNIEKVKNYNQKMLAALISIAVAAAAIGLIALLFFLGLQMFKHKPARPGSLLPDEEVVDLNNQNLRKQFISYESPYIIDTTKQIYLIKATVKNLNDAIKQDFSISSGSYESDIYSKKNRAYYSNNFNNLLLYNYANKSVEKICTDRIIGENLEVEYVNNDIQIIFLAHKTDTDGDNKLSTDDFASLYFYSINSKKLHIFSQENAQVLQYKYTLDSLNLIVTFGVDSNNDKKFDASTEQTKLYLYNLESFKSQAIISDEIEQELQNIIDLK